MAQGKKPWRSPAVMAEFLTFAKIEVSQATGCAGRIR
jgi:hypothetical protein